MNTWQPQSHDVDLYKMFIKTWKKVKWVGVFSKVACDSSQCQGLGNKELPVPKI